MHQVICNIGPFVIYSYGFMMATAFLFGTLLALFLAKRENISSDIVLDQIIWIIISSIVGARLAYVVTFWGQFKNNPAEIFMINHGGLVFYGGFIGGFIALILYNRWKKLNFLKILDIGTPAVLIGYSISRIGCFLNGCCYGIITNVPWTIKFPALEGLRHPTQIYSSLIVFLIFIFLFWFYKRKKFDGQIFYLGLLFYSVYRFFIEFLRDYSDHIFGLTYSQIISVIIFVVAGVILLSKIAETSSPDS